MADNPDLRNSPDSKRINVHEEHEVAYWTKALGVTRNELVAAVEKVGTMAKDVRDHFDSAKHARRG